jgi:transcriptional regulator with XRE-family HTH domain
MEFNEKLQELRKSRSLTQEELAEALFVSRTAISKWESGRGYPSLDSLKEISKFFSVSIDDLICSEEIISAAEDEKKDCMDKYISLICNTLDIFMALLLLLPVEAETDPDNAASQRVLMKCGFRPNGETGEGGPRYIVYGAKDKNVDRSC